MIVLRHFAAPAVALCLGVGVVGCSSEPRAEQVPPNAQLLVQGDRQLTYSAPRDGEVYVYDVDDETLLYSGQVQKGQSITVDPEEDRIMIDSKLALEKDIHAGNKHRIYFVPDRDRAGLSDDERVVERRTTEIRERPAAERTDPDTTIRREETKRIETDRDGDVTVKKETTIKTD
jgi:hypothetical protein